MADSERASMARPKVNIDMGADDSWEALIWIDGEVVASYRRPTFLDAAGAVSGWLLMRGYQPPGAVRS